MRKTFLKVALIGLLVGSLPVGFTSCKDYDDDIEQTNNQVADLKTKLASVETAIAALPSKADVTAAQAAAVAQAKADLEAVKAELQKAIDGKADKEAVEALNGELSKIQGQLETLDALKADVADALAAVSQITVLNETLQKQGQAIAGLTAQMETLTGSLATEAKTLKDDIAANKTSIEAIEDKLAELADKINGTGGDATPIEASLKVLKGMITSLRIVSDWGDTKLNLGTPITVTSTPTAPAVNGWDNALKFELQKGQKYEFTDSLLVQVSPAGAVLNAEDLTLVNSLKGNLDEFVTISSVEKYTELLTSNSRAFSSNGLYKINFKLNPEYDYEADGEQAEENDVATDFDQAVYGPNAAGKPGMGNAIRFALAFNDQATDADRYVLTPYDLTVNTKTGKDVTALDFTVNGKAVGGIHNRFDYAADGSSFMFKDFVGFKNAMDAVYENAKSYQSFDAAVDQGYAPVGDFAWNATATAGTWNDADNRTNEEYLYIAPDATTGEPATITIKVTNADKIYGYYVTIDALRATESGKSEIAAWEKYAKDYIKGINTVVTGGNPIVLTFDKDAAIPAGDVIGFRVWAVNYTGKLVDPDGRAFYIQYGQEVDVKTEGVTAAFTATKAFPTTGAAPEWATLKLGAYNGTKLDWMTSYSEVQATFSMEQNSKEVTLASDNKIYPYLAGSDVKVTLTMGKNTQYTATASIVDDEATEDDETTAQLTSGTTTTISSKNYSDFLSSIVVSVNSINLVDGASYDGEITIMTTGSNPQILQKIPVTVKKNVPTTLPNGFKVAAGLTDADGNINIFATEGKVSSNDVAAALKNVFFDNDGAVTFGANYAGALMISAAVDPSYANQAGTPALYMSANSDMDFVFMGAPNSSASKTSLWKVAALPWSVNATTKVVTNDVTKVLAAANESATSTTQLTAPTLPIVNGAANPITIWYQYDDVSYIWPKDANGNYVAQVKVSGENAYPGVNNAIVSKDYKLKVQTYPNTYVLTTPALPNLTFQKPVMLNANTIKITSSWTNAINMTVPEALQAPTENYMQIVAATTGKLYGLDGGVAQYFSVTPDNVAKDNMSVDENGVVTTNGVVIYGVPVKKDATTGAYSIALDDNTSIEVVSFVPNQNMVNAPAGAVSGNLTITYKDQLGLGVGFKADGTVKPYVKKSTITMGN